MKKVMCCFLIMCLLLSLASCGKSSASHETTIESSKASEIKSNPSSESAEPQSETNDAFDAIGLVDAEQGLFNVTLTIPADFIGEVTQEDLDSSVKSNGYKSATLNDDGSVTYVMTKAQHQELMEEIKANIDESIDELIKSGEYSRFVSIASNDN